MAVHSVSEINRYLKNLIAGERPLQNMLVRGEISNFKQYPSGHCYFTVKDKISALKCVMFRSFAQHLHFMPANGLQVIAGGSLAVYERDGVYQLYAESLVPEGTGDLALAFEQLKDFLMRHIKSLCPSFPGELVSLPLWPGRCSGISIMFLHAAGLWCSWCFILCRYRVKGQRIRYQRL